MPAKRLTLLGLSLLLFLCWPEPVAAQSAPIRRRVEKLTKQLDHKRLHRRLEALQRLGDLGKDAQSVTPRLLSLLARNEFVQVRSSAARALARIAPTDASVFKGLKSALNDTENHYTLRQTSAWGLGRMAASSELLRTQIVRGLAFELRSQRHGNLVDVALANAIGGLETLGASTTPSLEHALEKSPFADVRVACFVAMARVSKRGPQVKIPKLVANLRAESLARRAWAFGQLRAQGEGAIEAVDLLLKIAQRPKQPVYERVAALEALAAIAPDNEKVIDCFAVAMTTEHYLIQPTASRGLRVLGPRHTEAVPPLLRHLKANDPRVRLPMVTALHRVAPQEKRVVSGLLAALARCKPTDDEVYIHAVLEALRAGAKERAKAVPTLLAMAKFKAPLYEGRPSVVRSFLIGHALVVLAEVGAPESAVPQLLAELARDDPYTRPAIIRALGSVGAKGAPAVPSLVKLLEGKTPWVPMLPFLHDAFPTVEAIRALGRIGPAARAAIPVLTKISDRETTNLSQIGVLETQSARKALKDIRG